MGVKVECVQGSSLHTHICLVNPVRSLILISKLSPHQLCEYPSMQLHHEFRHIIIIKTNFNKQISWMRPVHSYARALQMQICKTHGFLKHDAAVMICEQCIQNCFCKPVPLNLNSNIEPQLIPQI